MSEQNVNISLKFIWTAEGVEHEAYVQGTDPIAVMAAASALRGKYDAVVSGVPSEASQASQASSPAPTVATGGAAPTATATASTPASAAAPAAAATPSQAATAPQATAPANATTTATPQQSAVTAEQLLDLARGLLIGGKEADLQGVLKHLGAATVSTIPQEKWDEAYQLLHAAKVNV